MNRHELRIGIINPLTLVGREIKSLIQERNVPHVSLQLLDTTGELAGTLSEIDEEATFIQPLTEDELSALDLVFFCGPYEHNAPWLARIEGRETVVIDLSTGRREESDGRLAVAGVNLEAIDETESLFVSPHPIVIPLLLIGSRLAKALRLDLLAAMVVQPASESGAEGIDELFQQTIQVLNVQAVPKKVFDRQLAFNLYPLPAAAEIEPLVLEQMRRLAPALPLTLSITQGTIFHSHMFSMFVRTGESCSLATLKEALDGTPGLAIYEESGEFSTVDASGKDDVLVSRITEAEGMEGGFWIWAASDNVRRSAALNAVLIAEEIITRRAEPVN